MSQDGDDAPLEILSQGSFAELWTTLEAGSTHLQATQGDYTQLHSRRDVDYVTDYVVIDEDEEEVEFSATRYNLALQRNDTLNDLVNNMGAFSNLDIPETVNGLRATTSEPVSPALENHNRGPSTSTGLCQFAHSIPSNTNYAGLYGFDIDFELQTKETKSANWTCSKDLKKLYVALFKPCPIKYRTAKAPPEGSYIRAMPIYMKPEHVKEVVTRCVNHSTAKDAHNADHPAKTHLVRCENKMANYVEDDVTQRESVLIPLESPQAGSDWVTNLFQFMCYSSCPGGLNRRNVQVIFTLEHNGDVIGRRAVEVRICACPGRDRKADEKVTVQKPVVKRPLKASYTTEVTTVGPKRQRMDDNEELFTLNVKGRHNYELLLKLRDSLEVMSSLTNSQTEQFKSNQTKVYKQASLTRGTSLPSSQGTSGMVAHPQIRHTHKASGSHNASKSFVQVISETGSTPKSRQSSQDSIPGLAIVEQESPSQRLKTIARWLDSIGMSEHACKFSEKGHRYMYQLDLYSQQTFEDMVFDPSWHGEKLWQCLLEYRKCHQLTSPRNSQVTQSGSTASTVSANSQNFGFSPGGFEVTRYMFKRTISCKQRGDEPEEKRRKDK